MQLTLSGSLFVDLTDRVNFQVAKTWAPNSAEQTRANRYTDVDEEIDIMVRGADPRDNIRNLYHLIRDIKAWNASQVESPVIMAYAVDADPTTLYRSIIVDMDLELPSNYHLIDVLGGVPNVRLRLTRRGLFISDTEGYFATTSGVSGTVVTFSGLSTLTSLSPTDVSVSGIQLFLGNGSLLPSGLLLTAGRDSYGNPAIAYTPASGLVPTGGLGAYSQVSDPGRNAIGTVLRYGDTILNEFPWPWNFNTRAPGVMSLINSYQKVVTYATVRSNAIHNWSFQWYANPLTSSAIVGNYQPCAETVYLSGGKPDPYVVYLGTISRAPQITLADLGAFIVNTTTPTSGYLYFDALYFVGMTDQTNIVQLQGRKTETSNNTWNIGRFQSNYFTGDSDVDVRVTADNDALPWNYRGAADAYTRSSTIDLAFVATNGAFWRYTRATGISGLIYLRLGISRLKGHVIPGL